jgi:hypothetical protein
MTISSFDRNSCRVLYTELQTVLNELAAKHGLVAKVDGGRFNPESFAPRVSFEVLGQSTNGDASDNVITAKATSDWNRYALVLGANPEWLGQTFKHEGRLLTVIGCKPSRPKNCISLREENGDMRRCSVEFIAHYLDRA